MWRPPTVCSLVYVLLGLGRYLIRRRSEPFPSFLKKKAWFILSDPVWTRWYFYIFGHCHFVCFVLVVVRFGNTGTEWVDKPLSVPSFHRPVWEFDFECVLWFRGEDVDSLSSGYLQFVKTGSGVSSICPKRESRPETRERGTCKKGSMVVKEDRLQTGPVE